MNKVEVLKLFAVIITAYPSFDPNEDRVNLYTKMLEKVAYEDAERLLMAHLSKSNFPPTIADLQPPKREYYGEYIPNAEETRQMLDEQAERLKLAVPCPPHLRTAARKAYEANKHE